MGTFLGDIGRTIWNGAKGIASAVGFDTSGYENDEAQKFQAEQAQINRDFQREMFDKQLAYQTEMWEKTNKYNSASEQMKRYREAGLNPYLMMTGGASAGAASSLNSPSPSGGSSPSGGFNTTHPGSSVSFLEYLQDKKIKTEQVENIKLDNDEKRIRNAKLEEQLVEQIIGNREDNRSKQIENAYKSDILDATFKQIKAHERSLNASAAIDEMEKIFKSHELKLLPTRLRAELSSIIANIALTKGMTNTEKWKAFQAQTQGLQGYEQYKLTRDTFDSLVRTAYNNAYWSQFQGKSLWQISDIVFNGPKMWR